MDLTTTLGLTAILEVAAAVAGWTGGFTYAACRPALAAPAWRHVAATTASAVLAVLAYFFALVAIGQGAVVSGGEGQAPTVAGLVLLATVLGMGAGVPWGLFRHVEARAALQAGTGDHGEDLWTAARRASARLFLPFAILGLVAFAPRAHPGASSTAGGLLAGALVAVVLAAVALTAFRHLGAIARLAVWGAVAGVPLVTALLMLSGVPLAPAFAFSAASALVWAPLFGLATWAVTGMDEAGFTIRNGLVKHRRSAWPSPTPTSQPTEARAGVRRPRRARQRSRRR